MTTHRPRPSERRLTSAADVDARARLTSDRRRTIVADADVDDVAMADTIMTGGTVTRTTAMLGRTVTAGDCCSTTYSNNNCNSRCRHHHHHHNNATTPTSIPLRHLPFHPVGDGGGYRRRYRSNSTGNMLPARRVFDWLSVRLHHASAAPSSSDADASQRLDAGIGNCSCYHRRRLAEHHLIDGGRPTGRRDGALACCGGSGGEESADDGTECGPVSARRVRINVSGQQFEIHAELLRRHPDTLLGSRPRRRRFFDRRRGEFFFDRHRPSFEAVFAYYQYGGKLKRPGNVPDDVFLDELEFFELERDVVDEYRLAEGYTSETVTLPANRMLRRLWRLFEYPETSTAAYAVAIVSVVVTLVSIVLFCVETLPVFSNTHCEDDEAPNFLDPFFVIETICTAWFTIEVVVRLAASPSKLAFWCDFRNLVDVASILPYYVTFFNVVSTMSCASAKSSASLAFLRVIRLVRIFKLTKHSVGFQVNIVRHHSRNVQRRNELNYSECIRSSR